MINGTKILAGFFALLTALTTGCSAPNTDSGSQAQNSDVSESETMELTQKTFTADSTHVKMLGRTAESEGVLWLALSASGVEFTFRGTAASVTILGDSQCYSVGNQSRVAVYVDGERVSDEMIDASEKTISFFASDTAKDATIRIVKLSESMQSTCGIKSIDVTSEGDIKPTAEKDLKIEFIGDSITCGYGVDDEDRDHHFATNTEDATKSYAYKTAAALDADYSFVSYSGHGIISGYTDNGNKVTTQLVPKFYELFAKSYGSTMDFTAADVEWDFTRFVPDYIVVNLGTNDASYCGNDKDKVTEYTEQYVEFLKMIRKDNADAHIIASLGVMDTRLCIALNNAVSQYTEATGDSNISTLRFTQQDGSTGYAADWHPTEATQQIAADELIAAIKALMA